MKGLVLDGGGVFGIGQASVLQPLDVSKFEFFAGTSIGSAIAASLALGQKVDLVKFFNEQMPKIFAGHSWRQYNILSCRYPDTKLNKALQDFLPGSFGSVKKPLFVTAVNLADQRLKVFNSLNPDDAGWPLWEVIRCAVAAETYFGPWKGYGDGGIFANNPSMVAIAAAAKVLCTTVENLEICSIGTGSSSKEATTVPTKSWSRARWGLWLLSALLSGGANTMHDYFARSLPLKCYLRLDFVRQLGWEMDDPDCMIRAAEAWQHEIVLASQSVAEFLTNETV